MRNGWFLILLAVVVGCKEEDSKPMAKNATPFDLEKPFLFPEMLIPEDNPFTEEGIALGRKLFYEKRLSGNNTLSCAGCHGQESAFSDPRKFSVGIDGLEGNRQSMSLVNIGYARFYFWDGRSATLEDQILEPVPNPVEMHQEWKDAMFKLQMDQSYPSEFETAFGCDQIDSVLVSKAIAQFLRTVISSNSKFDKYRRGEAQLTSEEFRGLNLFLTEGGDPNEVQGGQNGADCFHCHGIGGLQFSDYRLHNNGLDSIFSDLGAGGVTGAAKDVGRFKTPTLRNLSFTAPYMHDGRFATLEEVIEHYNSGGHASSTVDPFMKYTSGGLKLPEADKQSLIAFLKTLDDTDFIVDTAYSNPFAP
jgi:cytochrome c peroxidase